MIPVTTTISWTGWPRTQQRRGPARSSRRKVSSCGRDTLLRWFIVARMPERFRVEVASAQSITAIEYPAAASNRAAVSLILGHGAGAGQTSGFIVEFAAALAARGIDIVTFNFLYAEHGRRVPDPNARLEACFRAVIEAVRQRKSTTLAIGGKSMGGRIASQVAAGGAWCSSAIRCIRQGNPSGCAPPICTT